MLTCHAEPLAKHLAIDAQILRFTQNDSFVGTYNFFVKVLYERITANKNA